jgi:hypothetical protein
MIKKAFLILVTIILLNSCSGLLWNGEPDDIGQNLTITLNNPFYQYQSSKSQT